MDTQVAIGYVVKRYLCIILYFLKVWMELHSMTVIPDWDYIWKVSVGMSWFYTVARKTFSQLNLTLSYPVVYTLTPIKKESKNGRSKRMQFVAIMKSAIMMLLCESQLAKSVRPSNSHSVLLDLNVWSSDVASLNTRVVLQFLLDCWQYWHSIVCL